MFHNASWLVKTIFPKSGNFIVNEEYFVCILVSHISYAAASVQCVLTFYSISFALKDSGCMKISRVWKVWGPQQTKMLCVQNILDLQYNLWLSVFLSVCQSFSLSVCPFLCFSLSLKLCFSLSLSLSPLFVRVCVCVCVCHNEKKCRTNGKHIKRYQRYFD